jgi:hypothetical protein
VSDFEFLVALLEKGGLPGSIVAALAWAIYRFGAKPSSTVMTNETAVALDKLSIKIETTSRETSDKISQLSREMTDRLARVETDISNIHRDRK